MIRGYNEVRQRYTAKQMESKFFNTEKKLIVEFWTKGLEDKEICRGNTYMIRERVRWSLIQMAIVGLQSLPRVQISLIAIIDLIYFILVVMESQGNRIFSSWWLKVKHLFQEAAILIFLVVLTIFSFLKNSGTGKSKTFDILEVLVIVAVSVAMACEIILMIYTIFDAANKFFLSNKNAKKIHSDEKENIDSQEKQIEDLIEQEPVAQVTNKIIGVDQLEKNIKQKTKTNNYLEPLECVQFEPR